MTYSNHHIEKGKYRRIPDIVDAFQYDGNFVDEEGIWYVPDWAFYAYSNAILCFEGVFLVAHTPEGKVFVDPYDYIVKDAKGTIYPCKPEVFHSMYEKVG